jgi:hypothetical protein
VSDDAVGWSQVQKPTAARLIFDAATADFSGAFLLQLTIARMAPVRSCGIATDPESCQKEATPATGGRGDDLSLPGCRRHGDRIYLSAEVRVTAGSTIFDLTINATGSVTSLICCTEPFDCPARQLFTDAVPPPTDREFRPQPRLLTAMATPPNETDRRS